MTATVDNPTTRPDQDQVITRVREICREAVQGGRPRPGRPSLVEQIPGATDHQVRQALVKVDAEASPAVRLGLFSAADTDEEDPVEPVDLSQDAARPGPPAWTGPPAGDQASAAAEPLADAGASDVNAGEPAGGRMVAWAGFVFGSIVSVAANVLAARIPPTLPPADWRPSLVAQLGAAVWPVALLLAVEVLARVPWPSGLLWQIARYGGVVGVAAGSALISYGHIHDVLTSWGYSQLAAGVGPLVIDGLMVVTGFALLAMGGGRLAASRQPDASDSARTASEGA